MLLTIISWNFCSLDEDYLSHFNHFSFITFTISILKCLANNKVWLKTSATSFSKSAFNSKSLFDKCQEVIKRKSKTHINHKDEFWFLGLAKCKECNSAITAEKHFKFYPKTRGKIRYDYYRCGKKYGFCSQKYVSGGEFENQIREILFRHSLHELNARKMLNWLHADEINERKTVENKISLLNPQLLNVEQKLDRLLTGYLDQVIETSEYQTAKKKLIEDKTTLEEQISSFEKNQFQWVELVKDFINSALEAHKIAVCQAWLAVWGWKFPVQPDGGEVQANRKGTTVR